MIGVVVLVFLALYLTFVFPVFKRKKAETPHNERYDMQMEKLWNAAQDSMRDHKPLRAEKALLTILKFDEKNAAAYNRLGILYAKEQKFEEAIECFEIAQSLDNNPSSLHNVGLIYLETGSYEKAAMAFEQAIELEGNIPARHIALAKAREKLGRTKSAIEALENAYLLDHNVNTLRQILSIYEAAGNTEALADITARIEEQLAKESLAKPRTTRTRATSTRSTATKTTAKTTTRNKPTGSRTGTIKAKPQTAARTARTATTARSAAATPATRRRKQI